MLRIEDFGTDYSHKFDAAVDTASTRKIVVHVFPLEVSHKRVRFELIKERQSLWFDDLEDAIHAWNA